MNAKPLEPTKNRNANYKLLAITKAFIPENPDNIVGTCANIQNQIEGEWGSVNYDDTFCAKVSAPYVLARLCALFNGLKIDVGGQEYYKVTWQTVLKHKKTGHIVTFYDYKGGISYGSDIYGNKTPKEFIKDVQKLLKILSDERCPHPYDGCVVGEIA